MLGNRYIPFRTGLIYCPQTPESTGGRQQGSGMVLTSSHYHLKVEASRTNSLVGRYIYKREANVTTDQKVEVLCECLSRVIPAARAYGSTLKSRIKDVENVAGTFCTLVQVCSRTDQVLMKNEMMLEGELCLKWLLDKLIEWDKVITIRTACEYITLLEGMHVNTGYQIKYTNKYPRYSAQPSA